jgi:nucleotidyltransferase/DNA polymerase involved in DNA repair
VNSDRVIFHVDMDAFFASIEQLDDPSLRGKPVLVGYDGPRGVVAAASYEARKFNCHSAQPMSLAKRRCPEAIIVPVRFTRYREVSGRMFAIFDEYSPQVEPLSVDEAFLDLTGTQRLLGEPESVARRLKQRIKTDLNLTASIGVAPNKFLAKLASDLQKPDGLVIVRPDEIISLLASLPINKLWGVGPVTAGKLQSAGIHRVGDIQKQTPEQLAKLFGQDADRFLRLANGIDHRPVVPDREAKSIGQEQTFGVDVTEPSDVRRVLFEQVEQVGRRLRRHGLSARTVSLKIRYGEFETISRSTTIEQATNGTKELWDAASSVFDKWCTDGFRPVRLIGMSATQFSTGPGQLPLFVDPQIERQKKVDAVADQITSKFGTRAMKRGEGLS